MRVTFFQPYYFNIWESLGVGYLIAYLNRYSGRADVETQFFSGYFDDDESVVTAAAESDILAVSCTSPTYEHGVRVARLAKAKNPRLHTVFGGWHPSAVPLDVIQQDCVDQVVVGEGEEAILKVVAGNREPVLRAGRPQHELPHPDRDAICNEREVALCEKITGLRMTSFQSVRVCPMRCAFCAEHVVTGVHHRQDNPLRIRPVGDLINEIRAVATKYKLHRFKFVDATWNTSRDKVTAFCDQYLKTGAGLPWEVNVHASIATPEMFRAMAGAGCNQVNVGCESGSDRILRRIHKGITAQRIADVFRWAREAQLERRAYFLVGMPEESEGDLELTEELIRRIEPDVLGVTILCPYPGIDLYEPSKHQDVAWQETDEYSNTFWCTDHLSNRQLHEWQERLLKVCPEKAAWHNQKISIAGDACLPGETI